MTAASRLRAKNVSGGGTAIVTDHFNRADSTTSLGTADTGQTWTALSGTWGISSNKAYQVTRNTQAQAVVDAGVSDCTITVTLGQNVGNGGGICFRAVDANNLWFWESDGSSTLYKRVSGSLTTVQGSMGAFSIGDVMSIVLSGNTIVCKRNGTQLGTTVTDSFQNTATKHGLRDFGGLVTLDDFSVV